MTRKVVLLAVVILIITITLCACNGAIGDLNTNGNHSNGNSNNDSDKSEDNIGQDDVESNNGDSIDGDLEIISSINMYINDTKLEITLAENSSVKALIDLLKEGDIKYTAHNYGGFEKVGNIGYSLPTNNTQINAVSGDVMLYQGRQMVVFYGSNSWSYTRIGRINDYSSAELKEVLGNNNAQVIISLK